MAYNKTKFLESAQKYLNQGKVSQAIAEYQQILKHEPKDQVTLMTIGDLYVRQGETFQALEYFERLAQLFLSDGFVTKAIAIYKKIAKLAPEEIRPLERLAELYIQQGVLSEARPLFLQLAETHLKGGRSPQAVALLRKLLEVEPDNLRVQLRLADLYHTLGKEKEAAETFVNSAQRLLDRGEAAEAEKLADRALKIERSYAGAQLLKARALAVLGKRADAVKLLEALPNIESNAEATALLIEQYLHTGTLDRAATLARKAFEQAQNYDLAYQVAAALVEAGEADRTVELLTEIRQAMMEAGDNERLARTLSAVAARLPGRLEPLEWLMEVYERTGDTFHLPEAMAQLAEAAEKAGQLKRAQEIYEKMLSRSPEDEAVRQRLNQVRAHLGVTLLEEFAVQPSLTPVVEGPLVEARPVPVVAEPELDEDTQRYVTQALTDVDLFSSYGLTQKAIDLLESVLQRAPRHTTTLEKLFDIYLGAGDDRRTAELAAQLEQIYEGRGDTHNAERFFELRRRYQRAAGMAEEELTAAAEAATLAEPSAPVVEAQPVPAAEVPPAPPAEEVVAGQSAVHEVDLSEEWAALSRQLEEAMRKPPAEEKPAEPVPQAPAAAEMPPPEPVIPPAGTEKRPAAEYALKPKPSPAEPEPVGTSAAAPAEVMSAEQFLSELSREFEELGPLSEALPPTQPAAPGPASEPLSAAAPVNTEPLREVFEEFRAELGEMGAEEEDPETHYNLGIAYREMGLLEEAIGEFQKVAKAHDQGKAFRYAMQCCTLLGLAFMEKGQPAIAAMWYERALQTPSLDQETILALRYDLGVAQELAGDSESALKSFSQVYAMNIDYRDVADRIASLSKRR